MTSQVPMFKVRPSGGGNMPLKFSDLSRRQWRAIHNFCNKGFVPELSVLPNINFRNRDTGEVETHSLDDLLVEYDQDRRENARVRKAEKRLASKASR